MKNFGKKTNNEINALEVLLIDENNVMIGMVGFEKALSRARSVGLDLVEVKNDKNGNPVCKIMDYGKWRYDQLKKTKKKVIVPKNVTKEIKLSPTICDNDLFYRAKKVDGFLSKGNKIKLEVKFRGREKEHMLKTGKDILEKFMNLVTENYVMRSSAKTDSNSITLFLESGQ